MNNIRFYFLLIGIVLTLSSCEVIADIFSAGMWVGAIGVLLIIGLIVFVISKLRG
jgi:hypothetical protein